MATEDIKMNAFTPAMDGAYIYAETANGSQVKIKKSDLLRSILQPMVLPISSENKIGDYDNTDSGYGYYNNSSDTSGQYAPAGTAGIFIRFKVSYDTASTTFFFPSIMGESNCGIEKKEVSVLNCSQ